MVKKLSKMMLRLQAGKAGRAPLNRPTVAAMEGQKEDLSKISNKVIFMGRDLVTSYPFASGDVVISISDTGRQPPKFIYEPSDVLALDFHDEVTTQEESQLGYRWMMHDQAAKVVEFMLKHSDKQNIIVHCNYGQSRSKAVAKAIQKLTARQICHADYNGRIVQYTSSDRGNRRVFELVMMAHLEHLELNG